MAGSARPGDGGGSSRWQAEEIVPIRLLHEQPAPPRRRYKPRFAPRPGNVVGVEVWDERVKELTWRPEWVDVPASSSSPGVSGQKAADGTYLYFYLPGIGWRRVAHSSF